MPSLPFPWLLEGNGGSTRGSHGNGKDGIGAEAGLRGRAVESNHFVIEGALIGGVETGYGFGDFVVGVGDGFEHTFAKIFRFVAVAELEGFVFAGGGTGRDRCPAERSAIKHDVGFDRGIAARIDDLAGMDARYLGGHVGLFS